MKKEKFLFLTYEIICSEYSFISHNICYGTIHQKDENIVHQFLKHWCGICDNGYKKGSDYSFCFGEIVVKCIRYQKITNEERHILLGLGIS